jgi:hypothetical protein
MPEFILNRTDTMHLSDFVEGYVEAMFFTNGDMCDEYGENKLNELGSARLPAHTLATIKDQCEAFRHAHVKTSNGFTITTERLLKLQKDYDDAQAGRDFWFTRQGHGVGYWDREALSSSTGEALSAAARKQGEAYVHLLNGWIQHS